MHQGGWAVPQHLIIFTAMALPYFFAEDVSADIIQLAEDTSKHVVQVLRMQVGDGLLLTDGKGTKATCNITDAHRKRATVQVTERIIEAAPERKVVIAVSLLKNSSRFEWFLEKATELGVQEIIPLLCTRTESEKFRPDRMQQILISAMLQSQQFWLPHLHPPTKLADVLHLPIEQKLIAHCEPDHKEQLSSVNNYPSSTLMLIGPEGDFTPDEIKAALEAGCRPVALGNTRLRTETAALVAATLLVNTPLRQ